MIRAAAALAVLLQHVRASLLVDWPASTEHSVLARLIYLLAKFGHPAVIVFFVLSGFLVGSGGVRAALAGEWSFPRYMIHRTVRLEVVLLPALLLTAFWDRVGIHVFGAGDLYAGRWKLLVLSTPVDLRWRTLLGNAAFLHNILGPPYGSNAALWSLSYEFWYYVLFGLLVTAMLERRVWARTLLGAVTVAVCWFVGAGIVSLAPLWFLGLGVAMLPRGGYAPWLRRALAGGGIAVFAGFLLLFYGASRLQTIFPGPLLPDLLTGVLFSWALYGTVQANEASERYQRLAHAAANPSYSLYANHMPLVFAILAWQGARKQPTPLHCVEMLLWAAVVWGYGQGLYWLFESRTPRVRQWLEERLSAEPRTKVAH